MKIKITLGCVECGDLDHRTRSFTIDGDVENSFLEQTIFCGVMARVEEMVINHTPFEDEVTSAGETECKNQE